MQTDKKVSGCYLIICPSLDAFQYTIIIAISRYYLIKGGFIREVKGLLKGSPL